MLNALRAAVVAVLLVLNALLARLGAQVNSDWTEPFPPFRISGNLYYVGSKGLANYLITTPRGHILINSDLESSVPLIRASVEKLGFKFSDIKVLLISHAHWDHDAGDGRGCLRRRVGRHQRLSIRQRPTSLYPPTTVDRMLHDGDEVRLGDAVLVAHLTPGHTKGCTTWTMQVRDGDKTYHVAIVGSPNVNPGYTLVGNPGYPGIAEDFERTFRGLKALPVDIFLGAHGSYFGLEGKFARLKRGGPMPFIDPDGYREYIAERERAFRTELARQRGARP